MSKAWYKHYPSDWRSDKKLRLVSRSARSFWLDCIGIMHEENTHRLEVNGRPMTVKELSVTLGDNPRTAQKLLNELIEFGVCTVDCDNFITSRRVLRDLKTAEINVLNGRKGGNPSLKTREKGDLGVNPPLKAKNQNQNQNQIIEIDKSISWSFSRFWKDWPNKVSKQNAEKAWRKLSAKERQTVIEVSPSWFDKWRRQNPEAAPIHAATFLNGKRWLDESVGNSRQGIDWEKLEKELLSGDT